MNGKTRTRFWGFHPRIFWEGFRQLRTIGILSMVILTLEAILIPVGEAVSEFSTHKEISRRLVTLLNMHPLLILVMLLAPLMVFILFHFVNQRKASDFYHALPIGRGALFISLFASVFAWVLLITVFTTAVSLIVCCSFPMLFQVTYNSILPMLVGVLTSSLLLAGCAAIAMGITGTVFTNILVTGLIFFVPRFLLIYISEFLCNIVAIMPTRFNNPFLELSYNIPYALVVSVFKSDNPTALLLDNWMGCLYTALVGCLLFILANLMFRVRKSEAAGQSASTPFLQAVYRLLITFLVTLIPAALIIQGVLGGHGMDEDDFFIVLVLYIIAAIAFCVYELLTTKKPRRLLKVAPSFLIVLAADIVLFAVMAVGRFAILSFRPTAAEISSVSFSQNYYRDDYFSARSEEVSISDPQILRIVADRLEQSASYNSLHGGMSGPETQSSATFVTSIQTNAVTRQRLLRYTEEQTKTILSALAGMPAYQSVYSLPLPGNSVSTSCYPLSQEQSDEVYWLMVQEINALPFETRYELLSEQYHDRMELARMLVTVNYRGTFYNISIPLVDTLTPKACAQHVGFLFENSAAERGSVRSILRNLTQKQAEEYSIYVNIYDPNNQSEWYVSLSEAESGQQLETAAKLLEAGLSDKTAGVNEAFCRVSVDYPSAEDDSMWIGEEAYFTLSDEALEMLYTINEYNTTYP